jgi:cytochrome o ubiquinol oxidase subunit II
MNKTQKFILWVVVVTALLIGLIALLFIFSDRIAILNPKGLIALKQRDLIITSILLMLIVVIPVFVMTTIFAWKYRAGNTKAKYNPNWDYSFLVEAIWWGIPCAIIFVLAIIIWQSSHELDPFEPLEADKKPLTIQVVALQWKWLFIYPEQEVATINFIQFPERTPIRFEITADAPMNSFWIPQLGGQIYAMPGMRTELNLIADEAGSFNGLSANLSGEGFARMTFTAKATSETEFNQWIQEVKQSAGNFNFEDYQQLVKPTEENPVAFFLLQDRELFDQILMKYMMPMHSK